MTAWRLSPSARPAGGPSPTSGVRVGHRLVTCHPLRLMLLWVLPRPLPSIVGHGSGYARWRADLTGQRGRSSPPPQPFSEQRAALPQRGQNVRCRTCPVETSDRTPSRSGWQPRGFEATAAHASASMLPKALIRSVHSRRGILMWAGRGREWQLLRAGRRLPDGYRPLPARGRWRHGVAHPRCSTAAPRGSR